jgi:copper chaperone CopZ
MRLNSLILKISLIFWILWISPFVAEAEEKKLLISFDKNNICCIMNAEPLTRQLEKLKGVSTARFNMEKRKILVYFDPLEIEVQTIVDKVSKITAVDKKFILPEHHN